VERVKPTETPHARAQHVLTGFQSDSLREVKKQMPRIIHFEIPADNPERAVKFYQKVFGWKVEKWAGPVDYWLVTTGGDKEYGINGAITEKSDYVTAITNTIGVASFEDAVKKIKESGGKQLMPKTAVPGIGYMTYCKDTEGNVFGIMQNAPSAK
jgi:predicted enzyme related to lactoylglutathione lyase